MFDFLSRLLGAGDFLPHGQCYLWNHALIRLHVLSDLAIGAAYVAISLTLAYLVYRARTDIPFSSIFIGFGVFIVACGATHFMEVWTLWTPVYWVSGAVKLVTAAASVTVAIVLPPLVPKSLALIRSAKLSEVRKTDLESANQALQEEILVRKRMENEARRLNAGLEEQVRVKTAELADANQSVARMESAADYSSDAIVGLNLADRVTSWNPAAGRMYGYRPEEVLGCAISGLALGSLCIEAPQIMERVRRSEPVKPFEITRVLKTGELMVLYLRVSPIRNEAGELEGALLIVRDGRRRKRAEDVFRLAVDVAATAMVMVDGAGIIVLINTQTEKLFGYHREELQGQPVDILVPHKYRGSHQGHRKGFLREPSARSMSARRDLYGLRKDGSEFPVEIGLTPIETDQGTWVLSSIVDITERKRAGEMFRLAVDAAPNAMIMADGQGAIVLVNAQAERSFGYGREELIGQSVDILVPHEYRGRHPLHRSEFMGKPNARAMGAGGDLYGLRKDGSQFPVEIGLNPIETDQGTWVLSAIVDITERKRAQDEIGRLNQDLERRVAARTAELTAANAELEAFSYSVAHDLRAPLRHIAGFSRILADESGSELNPISRRYLQKVQDGANEMGKLIDDLLNLAKIGRQVVSRRLTPLNDLIDLALEELKVEALGREIEWRTEDFWSLECDPGLVKLVFVNLLSNALKYTRGRRPAVIQIGQMMSNGERVIFVRDNGAGFDIAYASKLFGVFQRLHKAADFEGTGVGLATVQRIVHKHGGRIWAFAEVDKGATFFFTIPNEPAPLPEPDGDSGKREVSDDKSACRDSAGR